MSSLSGSASVGLSMTYSGGTAIAPLKATVSKSVSVSIANGTGAGQANRMYADRVTVPAGSSVTLDLQALTDVAGAALNLVKIKHLMIAPASDAGNKVTVGAAASNAFTGPLGGTTPTVDVEPGDVFMVTKQGTGWTVDGTHSDLKLANAGGADILVDVVIVGTDA